MYTDAYINEGLRQLNDIKFYSHLQPDPTQKYSSNITRILKRTHRENKLDKNLLEFLTLINSNTGRFYLSSKIHMAGNSGWPVVSPNGTVNEHMSSFVDYLIKYIAETFPSFVRDKKHGLTFLSQLEIPDKALLVKLGVTSLYSNVAHPEGIDAVMSTYERIPNLPIDGETLSILLDLILGF